MAFIDFGKRSINLKIVYYGPGKSGKTTNLKKIYEVIRPESRGELTAIATQQDRTLFFDFLPLESNVIKGFSVRFQLFTVPGQVLYRKTRKVVLVGADGIVFVADSQWAKVQEDVESLKDLDDNLFETGKSIDSLPFVLQYNKRDLADVAPAHYLRFLLSRGALHAPEVEAVAVQTTGVFETLNTICRMTLLDFARKKGLEVRSASDNVCVEAPERRREPCLSA